MMKFLVIGLGSMGKRRIRNLLALGEKHIIGFDPNQARCDEVKDKYSIDICNDWTQALDTNANAWIVSTPPLTHMDYALQAAEKGIHVFIEAGVPDQRIDQLMDLAKQNKSVVAPSCTMAYFPGPQRIKSVVEQGELGKNLLFTYQSGQYLPDWHPWEDYRTFYVAKKESGAAREIVAFELVWLCKIFGAITEVTGMKDKNSDLEVDIDDHYQIIVKFANGLSGHLLVDAIARPAVRNFRLCCSEGTLEWDQANLTLRQYQAETSQWQEEKLDQGTAESGYINPEEPYINEVSDYLAAIRGEKAFPHSLEDDKQILDVLLAVESSVPVKLEAG